MIICQLPHSAGSVLGRRGGETEDPTPAALGLVSDVAGLDSVHLVGSSRPAGRIGSADPAVGTPLVRADSADVVRRAAAAVGDLAAGTIAAVSGVPVVVHPDRLALIVEQVEQCYSVVVVPATAAVRPNPAAFPVDRAGPACRFVRFDLTVHLGFVDRIGLD